jgi:hypothetical protein
MAGPTAMDADRWKRISPLLDELLEADADTRRARLAQIDAEDPPLALELAALLARQAALVRDAFLEGGALPDV